MRAASLLHTIKAEETWKGEYESFNHFLEDGCHIDPGLASKLINIWDGYVRHGNIAPERLEGVGSEKLYRALKLKGTFEERLVQAETLTRSEIREALKDPEVVCQHYETINICAECHKRVE